MYNLGLMHATGLGTARNCEVAVGLFKNVAERGEWNMWFQDALDMYEAGDVETALVLYLLLAESGFERAQHNAAYILDQHEELALFDRAGARARALVNFKRSADQGHTAARVNIGDYYYYGYTGEPDMSVAANEYRLAVDGNNPQVFFFEAKRGGEGGRK